MPLLTKPAISAGHLSRLVQPTLAVDELVVRPWRDDDAPAVLAAYRDPDIRRWDARTLTDKVVATHAFASSEGAQGAGCHRNR